VRLNNDNSTMKNRIQKTSRRGFLGRSVTAFATFSIVPGYVLGLRGQTPPSGKLNVACIGVGGRGGATLGGVSRENVVALCDVDENRSASAAEKHPAAKRYRDFRVMFDELAKTIDAVVVATPDHTHAVAAMAAIKRGKHVYCEKPLAHSIGEVRALLQAAREHKVITQLGNQGHSFDSIRAFCEMIWDGAIGNVHTIHAVAQAKHCKIDQLPLLAERPPVPPALDWDLWLGPAQFRPYHPVYLPGKWRAWSPFGSGAIGDWVCHVVDPVFWALDLGAPRSVLAEAKDYDPKKHGDTFPAGSKVTYEFAAKGARGPVKLVWFDGDETPPRPEELEPDKKLPGTGAIVMGDKGTIIYGSHGAGGVRLIPEAKAKAYTPPPQKLPRVKDHMVDWLDAIRAGKPAGSNFDYGGPLTEVALLGIIATKLLGQKLEWDGARMRFTNSSEANRHLRPAFRKGWSL
jgi:predicted dehydrogenase